MSAGIFPSTLLVIAPAPYGDRRYSAVGPFCS